MRKGVKVEKVDLAKPFLHLCAFEMRKVTVPFSLITAHFPCENGRFE